MTPPIDDHSADFARVRALAVDPQGLGLAEFSKGLTPRFGTVYRDIATGYAAILLTVAAAALAHRFGAPFWIVTPLVALMVGYWVAYIMLFIHEGAHWGLAADRDRSDRLANALIGWWAGMDIADYRRVHFEHHRSLGTTADTEASYFFPIDLTFVAKILFGIRVLEVLVSRKARVATAAVEAPKRGKGQIILGAALHGLILAALVLTGQWAAALGWCLGMALVFPFFGALRQILEHRSEAADPSVDYAAVDHGAVTRMFGDGVLARSFGAAGFNRHLLHHWQPGVSYTRLQDLEAFLMTTEVRPIIEARRTTYGRTLVALIRANAVARTPARATRQPAL